MQLLIVLCKFASTLILLFGLALSGNSIFSCKLYISGSLVSVSEGFPTYLAYFAFLGVVIMRVGCVTVRGNFQCRGVLLI